MREQISPHRDQFSSCPGDTVDRADQLLGLGLCHEMKCACSFDVSGGPIGDGCAQRCIVGSEFPADSEKEGRLFCEVCRRENVDNLTRYLQSPQPRLRRGPGNDTALLRLAAVSSAACGRPRPAPAILARISLRKLCCAIEISPLNGSGSDQGSTRPPTITPNVFSFLINQIVQSS